MDSYELSELITNKIMYRIGEATFTVGLFITVVGAIMMFYNVDIVVPIKKEVDMV